MSALKLAPSERHGAPVTEPRTFARSSSDQQEIEERLRVCFLYIGQAHQLPHSLPIAVQLALRRPNIEVRVASHSQENLQLAESYAARFPGAMLGFDRLGPTARVVGRKIMLLALHRRYFDRFDALVVPERTSLRLRRLGVTRPKLIWTRHGAGDRAQSVQDEIGQFDFVVLAGPKHERRLLEKGLIRPGRYVTGVYAKFDYVREMAKAQPPLFANGRPTVVYNPHFWPDLSSWPLVGRAVLDWFADQSAYNCVFAPHLRLFEPVTPSTYRKFERYRCVPHMKIDLGSQASLDMTYMSGADIYLGDVSSQVCEFVTRPRPCVFLNPRRLAWQNDINYRFWTLGEVTDGPDHLEEALATAIARQPERAGLQVDYARDTFGRAHEQPSAQIAADAIADYLADVRAAQSVAHEEASSPRRRGNPERSGRWQ